MAGEDTLNHHKKPKFSLMSQTTQTTDLT